jgi:hypothetical protein
MLCLAASLDGKLKNDVKQPDAVQAIVSVPSFKLWLLLHLFNLALRLPSVSSVIDPVLLALLNCARRPSASKVRGVVRQLPGPIA